MLPHAGLLSGCLQHLPLSAQIPCTRSHLSTGRCLHIIVSLAEWCTRICLAVMSLMLVTGENGRYCETLSHVMCQAKTKHESCNRLQHDDSGYSAAREYPALYIRSGLYRFSVFGMQWRKLNQDRSSALCAGPGHWGMNGILFLTAPILPTFVASFGRCIEMLMVPCSVLCGTRTRKLSAIAQRPSSMWLMTPTKTRPHKPMLAEWTSEILSLNIVLHDAIALARNGCSYGWAAQAFKCFAEHGKSSLLVAGAPVEVQPDELQLSFQMQQQAAFDAVLLDPRSCPVPGGEAVHVAYGITAGFLVLHIRSAQSTRSPHEHCKVAEDFEISHGVSFAAD